MSDDSAKLILQDMLSSLGAAQAAAAQPSYEGVYLLGADKRFLGEVSTDPYRSDSLSNPYGPFGNPYSPTSIFNQYGAYGSPYGALSLRNPYTSTPPNLCRAGNEIAPVSANPFIRNRIETSVFLALLKTNISRLINAPLDVRGLDGLRQMSRGYVAAGDGQLLGALVSDRYAQDSIFNEYGPYGSRHSPTSLFNHYSEYGSRYGRYSAMNPYASSPPQAFINGSFAAYVTSNIGLKPRVSVEELKSWAQKNVPRW